MRRRICVYAIDGSRSFVEADVIGHFAIHPSIGWQTVTNLVLTFVPTSSTVCWHDSRAWLESVRSRLARWREFRSVRSVRRRRWETWREFYRRLDQSPEWRAVLRRLCEDHVTGPWIRREFPCAR